VPNPYPWRFTSRLDALPPGSVALDLGAGGRRHPGVWSLDLREGDLLGDCLRLPLRAGCADLALSQAVLEHVTDPQAAVDEMRRVLRPGGALYVEAAFMQPVHMAPHHYFNITPHGLAWLLRDWDVEERGSIGTFGEVVDWVYDEASVPRPPRQYTRVCPPGDRYAGVSCGVYAVARRPV
jgi:SAM-dependent methyltransferase